MISAATFGMTKARYGLRRVCAAWELPRSTVYAQAKVGASRSLGPRHHDATIIPEAPDIMWGTDAAHLHREGRAGDGFHLGEHCTAELLGVHAA